MHLESWYLLAGLLFLLMALSATSLKRLPLTSSIIYLGLGFALGPSALKLLEVDLQTHGKMLEHLTEAAVLISLFTAGLKLRTPLNDKQWLLPIRLALPSMIVTIGLVAAVSVLLFDLPLGAGILLGAALAPTDPVLASDVQVADPSDRDRLRFTLTGEAAMNDGSAFPFVMLGLGLLGLHHLGDFGWRWAAVDLLWATAGGLAIGGTLGTLVGKLVIYLRRQHKESIGLDDFLALGLVALAYGAALWTYTYGFLAVFAAGLALRRIERVASEKHSIEPAEMESTADEENAVHPEKAPAHMAESVLGFNEQLERIAEVVVVVVLGVLLANTPITWQAIVFALTMLFILRPIAVMIGLFRAPISPLQRRLTAWFGIRGVGSVYYLTYALNKGIPEGLANQLGQLTITTIALSIVLHGISVTPLMNLYSRRKRKRSAEAA